MRTILIVILLMTTACGSVSKRETALELEVQMLRDGLAFQESQTLELNKELVRVKGLAKGGIKGLDDSKECPVLEYDGNCFTWDFSILEFEEVGSK